MGYRAPREEQMIFRKAEIKGPLEEEKRSRTFVTKSGCGVDFPASFL